LNILIITTRVPYPPYKGDKLKIFNIAKQLTKKNSVTIITLLRNKKQINDIEELKKYNLKVVYEKISLIESCFNTVGMVFTRIPFQVAWYKSKKMQNRIKALITSGNYDVAYYHLIRSAQYIISQTKNSLPIQVVDFTDAVSLYLDRFAKVERNPLKKILLRIEKKHVENYEKIAEKFQVVFICSETDREYLLNRGIKSNIRLLPNGVDVDSFKLENIQREKNRIIFTGNMPYYANYDAAIYFAKDIFPKVLEQIPDAKFYIVGQHPPRRVKALSSENVIVTGYVEDLRKEYLKSCVNVAPMRFGAGTLNKILEAIVLNVPVIATSIAVEGLPAEIKKCIIVAKDSIDFADKVIKLLNNNEYNNQSNRTMNSDIIKSLSWENIVSRFESDLAIELSKLKS
jgi:sugar transferase (PEP-CTERM/EpsH1 system associated)